MDLLWSGLTESWNLLTTGNPEIFGIALLTLDRKSVV